MKPCGRCGVAYDEGSYHLRDTKTGQRHTICVDCRRGYWRAYHHRDRDGHNARRRVRVAQYRLRNRTYVLEYLRMHPCVDCGLLDPIVMEFDHVRGKKHKEISVLIGEGARLRTLQAEIAKCEVRCANCHRRKTYREVWRPKPDGDGQVFSALIA